MNSWLLESSLRELQSPAPDLEIAHRKRSDCLLHPSGWGVSKTSYNHPGKRKFKDVLKNYKQGNLNETMELIFSACSSHQTPNHLKTLKVGARPWTKTFRPFRKSLGISNHLQMVLFSCSQCDYEYILNHRLLSIFWLPGIIFFLTVAKKLGDSAFPTGVILIYTHLNRTVMKRL